LPNGGSTLNLADVNWLTKQEQLVIGIILALLLTGLLVKHHRAGQLVPKNPVEGAPPIAASQPVKS